MEELSRQADMAFYGPGFKGYDPRDELAIAMAKKGGNFDAVVLGHAWLSDRADEPVDPHPSLNPGAVDLPKAAILNKEYVNLEAKLGYIRGSTFDLVFTHHHEVEKYEQQTGIKFVFWPFAFDHRLFNASLDQDKPYDISFSGILQNSSSNADQTDIRVRIQKKIFVCLGDVPLRKKGAFMNHMIFWNSIPRRKADLYLAMFLKRYRHMPAKEYSNMQRNTKIYINTLSPIGLVSPRFFENMASRAMVFCEGSSVYENIFPTNCYVSFNKDLTDFEKKISYYLRNETERHKIAEQAYQEAMKNHTWQRRVAILIDTIGKVK